MFLLIMVKMNHYYHYFIINLVHNINYDYYQLYQTK